MILRSLQELLARYPELSAGDIYAGHLPTTNIKTALLVDLMERGIHLIPSPLARILSASKTAQAQLLSAWMLPGTFVIHRRADLIDAANRYAQDGVRAVVTKQERMHCGHGIRRWESTEILYNLVSMDSSAYPFVLQPFVDDFTDVRVIIVDDFVEAYARTNPGNFRQNLSAGGESCPIKISKEVEEFCRSAMIRGRFPFAHLDLQIIDNNRRYLSEIALNGGIAGARIDRKPLDSKKQAVIEKTAAALSS